MNPWRGLRGLPRAIWILSAASLINRAGTMVMPFLVLYLTRSLRFSDARAGGLLALYGATSLVAAPLSGRLCDRYGALAVMRASLVASAAMMLAFPLATSFPAIVASTILLALAGEMFRPANLAILAEIAPPAQRKQAFALSRLAVNLGMSIGPAAGGFLAAISFSALFLVDGLTSLAAAAVLITAVRPPSPGAAPIEGDGERRSSTPVEARAGGQAAGPSRSTSTLGALADRRFLQFSAALLPAGIVFFQLQAALPLYVVRNLGLSEPIFGLVMTVNTVLIVLIEVPLNTMMSRWPHRRALSLGALLTGAGFGATGLAVGPLTLAATVVVWTFGEMIFFPGSSAYVADLAPPDRRGDYMGAYSMSFGICFSIGPWLGTVLLERWGGTVLWSSMLFLGLVAAVLMIRLPELSKADARGPEPEPEPG